MHPIDEYIIPVVIGITFSIFNFLALSIILYAPKLRSKSSTYPIFSFLIVSTIQGIFVAPLYTFRKLHGNNSPHGDLPSWICDASRATYIVCHHIMTASLLIVSLNRVFIIWYPYFNQQLRLKKKMFFVLTSMWVITISIDMLPFLNRKDGKHCAYRPERTWGMLVIIFYDMIPCALIIINCLLIWIIAYRAHSTDIRRASCVQRSNVLMASREEGPYGPTKKKSNRHISCIRIAIDTKATFTSLVVIIIYVICWGPLGIFYMIDHFCHNCLSKRNSLRTSKLIIRYLYYSSSVWTPLAYCWMNKEFRRSGWKLLRKFSSMSPERPRRSKSVLTVQCSKNSIKLGGIKRDQPV